MTAADLPLPDDAALAQQIAAWLPAQRWFSAKNHPIVRVDLLQRVPMLRESGMAADHLVIEVAFRDTDPLSFQLPIGYRPGPADDFAEHALSVSPRTVVYDGLRDERIIARYVRALAGAESVGPLRFHGLAGTAVDPAAHGRMLSAEQSNTTVVFGDNLLVKFFRQISIGINPDVELHHALGELDCPYVAPLRGWVEADLEGVTTTLAMAQEFVGNASDGWRLALTSVRDLFAEADLHAAEVGTDFAAEAERLGAAVAHVHADLARALGAAEQPLTSSVLDTLRRNLDVATRVVPELAEHRDAVLAVYEEAAKSGPTPVQRIHGDLHLGQVLRAPDHWLLIDFEGEPLKPVVERRLPDSPLRDVAGMLRSFDYAGHQPLGDGLPGESQRKYRAQEWVSRNSSAFCDGYAAVAGTDPREQSALLRAYELDKAVYEAAYEARNRPTWLHLPLRAIGRLVVA
ncbi:phosphotransferase [Aldersonia sp. NBC_00410]|uniref:maltokinase N-terminal cap-like domain-containing protein n=1 Tax=Aldersonia sp. NBC_00410 TaxID=2975954 RepID=UPI00225013C4|nr:phosphotransferase [Aldersonia sp. NBC_00410]MCX5042945.1 phosphotransferase [Aldersonia sp. NBC_00410]